MAIITLSAIGISYAWSASYPGTQRWIAFGLGVAVSYWVIFLVDRWYDERRTLEPRDD